jgi:hypothetical protein
MSAADHQPNDVAMPASLSEPSLIPLVSVTAPSATSLPHKTQPEQSPIQDTSSELYIESKLAHTAYLKPLSNRGTSSIGTSLSDVDSDLGTPVRPSSSLGLGSKADFDDSSSCASSLATAELAALRVTETNKYGRVDRYGFIIIDEHGHAIRNRLMHEDERKDWKKEREATRAVKWVEMLFCLEREANLLKWPKAHRKVHFVPHPHSPPNLCHLVSISLCSCSLSAAWSRESLTAFVPKSGSCLPNLKQLSHPFSLFTLKFPGLKDKSTWTLKEPYGIMYCFVPGLVRHRLACSRFW